MDSINELTENDLEGVVIYDGFKYHWILKVFDSGLVDARQLTPIYNDENELQEMVSEMGSKFYGDTAERALERLQDNEYELVDSSVTDGREEAQAVTRKHFEQR